MKSTLEVGISSCRVYASTVFIGQVSERSLNVEIKIKLGSFLTPILWGTMDTRNSRVALLQSQNNSPQLSVHSQPHGDAPSTSLLRPHEHHHDGPYHYERTDVKYKQFRRSCRPGLSVVTQIALCIILLGFLGILFHSHWHQFKFHLQCFVSLTLST